MSATEMPGCEMFGWGDLGAVAVLLALAIILIALFREAMRWRG